MKADTTITTFSTPHNLISVAKKGLRKQSLDVLAKAIGLTDREIARILNISERTLHRYQQESLLDVATTERLLKLALLYQKGEQVFEDLHTFKQWMREANAFFDGKTPLEMLDTFTGFGLVEDELLRIEYNVYA